MSDTVTRERLEEVRLVEHERAVLGAILLDNDAFDRARRIVSATDFSSYSHRAIFHAMDRMIDSGEIVDLLSLSTELSDAGEDISGAYISELSSSVPTTANIEYYARQVRQESVRRTVVRAFRQGIEAAQNNEDPAAVIDRAEESIAQASSQTGGHYVAARGLLPDAVAEIEANYHMEDEYYGIPSGLGDLDDLLDGFVDEELTVLSARPSVGKTSMALTMARNIAENVPVGFFTLEMSNRSLMQRLLAMDTGLNLRAIRGGNMRPSQFKDITDAAGKIDQLDLYLYDSKYARFSDLKARAREMVRKSGVKILFIDYLTLIRHDDERMDRRLQIVDITHGLKALAGELRIPIVVLAQISRLGDGDVPRLTHLKESGSIEEDADVVLALHRDPDKQGDTGVVDTIDVHVLKNRNGAQGIVEVAFVRHLTKFEGLMRRGADL